VIALLVVRILLMMFALSTLPENGGHGLGNDANRFHEIAQAPGTPYKDSEVEVPPLGLSLIELLDGPSGRVLAQRLAITMLGCDILIAVLLWTTWGPEVGFRYWVLGTPLAFFIYLRLDLLSVAFAVAGAALARRRRETWAGFAVAAGFFSKLWPIVLVPLLWSARRVRAASVALAVIILGIVGWIAWVGTAGLREVVTYRGATGWEVESPVGSVLWVILRWPARIQEGARRVGSVDPWLRIALLVAIAASVLWIARRCRERPALAEGVGATAAVASLLVFSTLLSHQYVVWLLPWVAVAGSRRITLWAMIAAISATAVILYTATPIETAPLIRDLALLTRNCAILVIYVLAMLSLGLRSAEAVEEGEEAGPVRT
jgi:hypothetical protein